MRASLGTRKGRGGAAVHTHTLSFRPLWFVCLFSPISSISFGGKGGTRFEVLIDSVGEEWIVMAFLGSCLGRAKLQSKRQSFDPKYVTLGVMRHRAYSGVALDTFSNGSVRMCRYFPLVSLRRCLSELTWTSHGIYLRDGCLSERPRAVCPSFLSPTHSLPLLSFLYIFSRSRTSRSSVARVGVQALAETIP